MVAALAPINTTLADHTATLANHTATLAAMMSRLDNIEARQRNMTARSPQDAISELRNNNGNIAPNFPPTKHALNGMESFQLRDLLVFYGCNPNPEATRLIRLKQFLGMNPL
mmetsp:Transcript_13767/g.19848  ORF Transcript_13767/g.19848 Transcript_13767/m.19848 type:complete len:112 (-) Transcript_13767:159-494(-)